MSTCVVGGYYILTLNTASKQTHLLSVALALVLRLSENKK